MDAFAPFKTGREDWGAHQRIPRHAHDRAYAAIVLAGGYEECGNHGRFRVGPGDVLLHGAFDAHLDRFPPGGAQILNLVLADPMPPFRMGHVNDPDNIAHAAERDSHAAVAIMREQLQEKEYKPGDWPELLARDLHDDAGIMLEAWADAHDLRAETISRGFGKAFGLTPVAFRAEARARRAWRLIIEGNLPLAQIAAVAGFADQAHLTRSVHTLTGLTPGAWRRSNPFKTDRQPVE